MRLLPTAAGFVCLICFAALPGRADEPDDATPPAPAVAAPIITPADKTLHPGESEVYEFDGMTTAAVGSPLVADIVPLSARRLLVNAKGVGRTTLFVYDRRGAAPAAPGRRPHRARSRARRRPGTGGDRPARRHRPRPRRHGLSGGCCHKCRHPPAGVCHCGRLRAQVQKPTPGGSRQRRYAQPR